MGHSNSTCEEHNRLSLDIQIGLVIARIVVANGSDCFDSKCPTSVSNPNYCQNSIKLSSFSFFDFNALFANIALYLQYERIFRKHDGKFWVLGFGLGLCALPDIGVFAYWNDHVFNDSGGLSWTHFLTNYLTLTGTFMRGGGLAMTINYDRVHSDIYF